MAFTAEEMIVRLNADTSKYQSAIQKVIGDTQRMASRVATLATQAGAALGAGLATVGTVATVAFGKFELELSRIEGLVGANREQMEKYTAAVLKMAPALGKSPQELASALYYLTSAGLEGEKALSALEQAAKASTAGLGTTMVVADALSSAMNAYSKSGLTAAQATDAITAAVKFGKVEADQFASTLGKVIPLASSVGVSFQDLLGTAAALSRVGMNSAEAMTSIQAALLSIVSPSEGARKAMEASGLSVAHLQRLIKQPGGLVDAFRLMEVALKNNADGMSEALPNVRALRGALALLAQESKVVDEIMAGVRNSVGTTDLAFNAAARTLSFQWAQVVSQLKVTLLDIGTVIGTHLTPMLASFAKGFARTWEAIKAGAPAALESIRSAVEKGKAVWDEYGRTVTIVAASVAGAYVAYKTLALGIGVTTGLLSALGITQVASAALWVAWKATIVATNAVVLVFQATYSAAMAAVTLATTGFTAVLTAANLVMAGATVAAAAAAGAAIVAGFALGYSAVMGVIDAAKSLKEALAGLNTGSLSPVSGVLAEWGRIIAEVVKTAKTDLPGAFGIATAGARLAVEQVKALFPPLWAFAREGFSALWDVVTSNMLLGFQNAFAKVVEETLQQLRVLEHLPGGNIVSPAITAAQMSLGQYQAEGRALQEENVRKAQKRLQDAMSGVKFDFDTPGIEAARKALDEARQKVGDAEWLRRQQDMGPHWDAAAAAAGKAAAGARAVGDAVGATTAKVNGLAAAFGQLDAVKWGSAEHISRLERQADLMGGRLAPQMPARPVAAAPAAMVPVASVAGVRFDPPAGNQALAYLARIASGVDVLKGKPAVEFEAANIA